MNNDQNCIIDYIEQQDDNIRPLLYQVHEAIRGVLPKAEERISWKMPTYWDGHNIIHFAAFTKHLGIYPGPDAILHFSDELKSYKTSKGAIQLPYNQPIPIELIKDITCWCYQTGNHH